MSRRRFLAGAATSVAMWNWLPRWAFGAPPAGAQTKAKIRVVFSHHHEDAQGKQSEPGWPYLGYDLDRARKKALEKLRARCPDSEFLPAVAYSRADAEKILEGDKSLAIDGYLAYMLGGGSGAAGRVFAAAGKPTIYVGDLYCSSGDFYWAAADARRKGLKAFSVISSRFDDVVQAVRCFECLKKLKSSVILDVGAAPGENGKAIEEVFGTKVIPVGFEELGEAYRKVDRAQAHRWAKKWSREARKVVEPTPQEIEKSGTMYLGMKSLLEQHRAQAITINCLGGFYSGKMDAYPCLGHFQLNNDGLVGACEADLQSTITMLLMTYLVGKPGYISDPVIDTATGQVIYLHCVAPTKVFGPSGPANPYEIRSHAEDRKGAAIRSLMPSGHVVTTLKLAPTRKEVILHQAKTTGNINDPEEYPKSCRTKLAAKVMGDIDKFFGEWDRWGWHRVTFYGDHKLVVSQLSALIGFKLIEEA